LGVGKKKKKALSPPLASLRTPTALTFCVKFSLDRCRVAPPDAPPPERAMDVGARDVEGRPNACEGVASGGRGREALDEVDCVVWWGREWCVRARECVA